MIAVFKWRAQIEAVNAFVARQFAELVSAINTPPVYVGGTAIQTGSGNPEGRVYGSVGDLYLRTDPNNITTLYTKARGLQTVNGWTPQHVQVAGTWTPRDVSGAGLVLTQVFPAQYIKHGPLVFVNFAVIYPATASGAAAILGGLPFQAAYAQAGLSVAYTNIGTTPILLVDVNSTNIYLFKPTGPGYANVEVTNAQLRGSGVYLAAA